METTGLIDFCKEGYPLVMSRPKEMVGRILGVKKQMEYTRRAMTPRHQSNSHMAKERY